MSELTEAEKRRHLLARLERAEERLAEKAAAAEEASRKLKPVWKRSQEAASAQMRAQDEVDELRRELFALVQPRPEPEKHAARVIR